MKNRWCISISILILFFFISCSFPLGSFENKLAYVYGISVYDPSYPEGDGDYNLTYCDDDAIAVAKLLEDNGFSVTLRLDQEATRARIFQDIQEAGAAAGENSLVVFYYAGHGGSIKTEDTSDESLPNDAINEFIYPADSLGPGIVEDNFITDDQLGTSFQNNLSHTQNVLILDSCNSGGFISTRDTGWDHRPDDATSGTYVMGDVEPPAFMAMNLYFANLPDSDISDNNTLVLTSAGQLEEAPESALYNHGVFTYYLLETPITADANSDGFITVLEAFEHIDYRMRTEWNEYYSHPLNRNLPHVTVSPLDYVLFEAD